MHLVGATTVPLKLDRAQRFFREDIGEGLKYISDVARQQGIHLPMTEKICRWYASGAAVPSPADVA